MDNNSILAFLKKHQPLLDLDRVDPDDLDYFSKILEFLSEHPCDEAVPLLLGAVGEGDGAGVYMGIDWVLSECSREVVITSLAEVMLEQSPCGERRSFALMFAMSYLDARLLPIVKILAREGNSEERGWAIANLRRYLEAAVNWDKDDIHHILRQCLAHEPLLANQESIRQILPNSGFEMDMTVEQAIAFLQLHQPLSPSADFNQTLGEQFKQAQYVLAAVPHPLAPKLILGAIGKDNGQVGYQNIESIFQVNQDVVSIAAIVEALAHPQSSSCFHAALISARYADKRIVQALIHALASGLPDTKVVIALIFALKAQSDYLPSEISSIKNALSTRLASEPDENVLDEIRTTLGKLG